MDVILDALAAPDLPFGCIVSIGNYDGVHRGQQHVLSTVIERARETGLRSVVVTFDPHPLKLLRPELAPVRLTTEDQKVELLREQGVDTLVVVRFDQEFANWSARRFADELLRRKLGAEEVYVGSDFHFGKGREGSYETLEELGRELGFRAAQVDEQRNGGERISSTRIRELVTRGDTLAAEELLGRPYAIRGEIARGDRMGNRMGWPTINVVPENNLLPLGGVYTSRVYFPSFSETFLSVTNIGRRPTVYENYKEVVESHILDFRSDVYGEQVELQFLKRLRDEMQFDSIVDLTSQIRQDVEATRDYFAARGEDGSPSSTSVIDSFFS